MIKFCLIDSDSPRRMHHLPDRRSAHMPAKLARQLNSALAERRRAGRLRTLEARSGAQGARIVIDGRRLVNFSSNDYLGLAADHRIVERVGYELDRHGFGSGAAALLSGRSSLHAELERELAAFAGMEAALLFSSGYMANLGALGALLERSAEVHHDRLNHASLIDAVVASPARHRRYAHLDYKTLDRRLAQSSAPIKWVITESIFSMDGDAAPLDVLTGLAAQRDAELYVDDAHGFGVTAEGRGAFAELNERARRRCIFMVTFGKALGSVGAAIVASQTLIDHLVQHARTFVYDTALPPVCAAASLQALEILQTDAALVQRLTDNITDFRQLAGQAGLPFMASATPIQPLVIGDDRRTVEVAQAVCDDGFYVRAIRPPTVPVGTARLRVTLSAAHSAEDLRDLINALEHRLALCR